MIQCNSKVWRERKLIINGRHLGVCRPLEDEKELVPLEPVGNIRVSLDQEDEVQEQRSRTCNPYNLVGTTGVSLE